MNFTRSAAALAAATAIGLAASAAAENPKLKVRAPTDGDSLVWVSSPDDDDRRPVRIGGPKSKSVRIITEDGTRITGVGSGTIEASGAQFKFGDGKVIVDGRTIEVDDDEIVVITDDGDIEIHDFEDYEDEIDVRVPHIRGRDFAFGFEGPNVRFGDGETIICRHDEDDDDTDCERLDLGELKALREMRFDFDRHFSGMSDELRAEMEALHDELDDMDHDLRFEFDFDDDDEFKREARNRAKEVKALAREMRERNRNVAGEARERALAMADADRERAREERALSRELAESARELRDRDGDLERAVREVRRAAEEARAGAEVARAHADEMRARADDLREAIKNLPDGEYTVDVRRGRTVFTNEDGEEFVVDREIAWFDDMDEDDTISINRNDD